MLDTAYEVIVFPEQGISLRRDAAGSRLPMTDTFQAAPAANLRFDLMLVQELPQL